MLYPKERNGHQTNTHFGSITPVIVTGRNPEAVEKLEQQGNANTLTLSEAYD